MKGYLATHFFNKFALDGTEAFAQKLEKETPLKWYIPHRNGEINDKKNNDDIITDVKIYQADAKELMSSDIIIANLDGVEIDSGVAGEIGMVASFNELATSSEFEDKLNPKLIIGYYTDMRQYGTGDNHYYINLFVKGACNCYGAVVDNEDDIVRIVNNWYKIVESLNDKDAFKITMTYKVHEHKNETIKVTPFMLYHAHNALYKDDQFFLRAYDGIDLKDFAFKDIIEII